MSAAFLNEKWADWGTIISPSTIPTLTVPTNVSNGISDILRAIDAPTEAGISGNSFATTSYLQSVKSGWQDVLNLRYKGQSEVANYRNQAALSRFKGQSAYNAGRADAWVTGIKGAASVLSQGYDAGYFATKGK